MQNQKLKLVLCCCLLVISTTCRATDKEYSSQHTQVMKYFKSGKEPKVKDAIWTSDHIFKVGVLDDGSRRDGYADYVCQVLYDYGLSGKGVWVQVIDISKLSRAGKWVKLGEAHCK